MNLNTPARISVPISICICTMDRPAELARCLASIEAGEVLPEEIVVSDDSRGSETRALCGKIAGVRYIVGPRCGQGPNRQTGAQACRAPYVSFVDDDAVVSPSFLRVMHDHAVRFGANKIFTGSLLERGDRITPTNLTFWGHFGAAVKSRYETVIFNSNLFPRDVFDRATFEPRIKYGYEDSDFCTQALALGYQIIYVPEACNEHIPSPINRVASLAQSEYARYYTVLKRYFRIEHRPFAGCVFAAFAPLKAAAGVLRRGKVKALPRIAIDFCAATRHFFYDWRRSVTR